MSMRFGFLDDSNIGETTLTGPPQNANYDFLTRFELIEFIYNTHNSIDHINHAIKSAITEHQFRAILESGIQEVFKQTNDFTLISNINKQLHLQQQWAQSSKVSININTPNNINININSHKNYNRHNTACGQALGITSLVCKTISYLEYKSFVNCHLINKEWLRCCYCPLSLYGLNLEDLYHHKRYSYDRDEIVNHYRNLSRFRFIRSLSIDVCSTAWGYPYLIKYLNDISSFGQIIKLSLCVSKWQGGCTDYRTDNQVGLTKIFSLLTNSRLNLKHLILTGPIALHKLHKFDLYYGKDSLSLTQLTLKDIDLTGLYLMNNNCNDDNINVNDDGNNINTNNRGCNWLLGNCRKLEVLTIESSVLPLQFWKEISNASIENLRELTMNNIKTDLDTFTWCDTHSNGMRPLGLKELLQLLRKEFIPNITSKLINIEKIDFGRFSFEFTGISDDSYETNLKASGNKTQSWKSRSVQLMNDFDFNFEFLSNLCGIKLKSLKFTPKIKSQSQIKRSKKFKKVPWKRSQNYNRSNNNERKESDYKCNFINLQKVHTVFMPSSNYNDKYTQLGKAKLIQILKLLTVKPQLQMEDIGIFGIEYDRDRNNNYKCNANERRRICNARRITLEFNNDSGSPHSVAPYISTGDLYTGISNLEFGKLNELEIINAPDDLNNRKLSTKELIELLHVISMIIGDRFCKVIKSLALQTRMYTFPMNQNDLSKITDYLIKIYNRGNIDLKLQFVNQHNGGDVGLPYQLGVILMSKLMKLKDGNNNNCIMSAMTHLSNNKFVAPTYGGNKSNFKNKLDMNDSRISIGVRFQKGIRFVCTVMIHAIRSNNCSTVDINDMVDSPQFFDIDNNCNNDDSGNIPYARFEIDDLFS